MSLPPSITPALLDTLTGMVVSTSGRTVPVVARSGAKARLSSAVKDGKVSVDPAAFRQGIAGALLGNVGDLAKWANALHHGRVVNPVLYTQMTSPAQIRRPGGRGLVPRCLPAVGTVV